MKTDDMVDGRGDRVDGEMIGLIEMVGMIEMIGLVEMIGMVG